MKDTQNCHGDSVLSINHDVVGAYDHLARAIDTPHAVELRVIGENSTLDDCSLKVDI